VVLKQKRRKRKRRTGEVTCRCHVYRFPHRMMGGRCDGGAYVATTFDNQMYGSCRDCFFRVEREDDNEGYVIECQVVQGTDEMRHCPALQEFIAFHEIRLYGIHTPNRHKAK
jgi:hypothetical protein